MYFYLFCFCVFCYVSFATKEISASATTELANSCIGKEDGSYWLKLMEDDDSKNYPSVFAKCSNEYTILDYSYDNNLKEYFSSWNYWHYAIAGPNNGDTVNWEEWYLPSDANTKYLVSPDCNTCDEEKNFQLYETKTTYWMTGNLFSCWWNIKGFPVCDLDWDTYTCYYCGEKYFTGNVDPTPIDESSPADYYDYTGQCVTSIESSQKTVPQIHEECTIQTDDQVMKPSLGIQGSFCVCVQPSEQKTFNVANDKLTEFQARLSSLTQMKGKLKEAKTSSNNIVQLYQKDFLHGTYRITEAGTYQIMENIEFEFNQGNFDDPFVEGAWWPAADQAEEYPGAGDYRDPYFLGFFAGITIETSDVVLDLNSFTLKMSHLYYFHQRWFSIIELASQYFLPGQGPGFMGYDPKFASKVVIRNGVLGLTSHFGIHGNFNDDLQILNIKVQDFETHGIQLNGWSNLVMSNVDIGPSSSKAYLKAEFGHARVILPRLRKIYEENPDGVIHFAKRDEMTMKDIADELELQMKMALDWAITKTEPTTDDDTSKIRWIKAQNLFINKNGIPFSSSLTGLFLNLHSTSVFTFNLNTDDYSVGATLNNIKIHDLQHSFQEWIRLCDGQEIYVNPFTAPMDALSMIGEQQIQHCLSSLTGECTATYKGNALTDAYIAMNKLSDNWGYLGGMMIKNSVTVAWAENEASFYDSWAFACNVDPMLHSGKGILGFRMDGVKDVEINGLEIYNLLDQTPLGRTECGAYDTFWAGPSRTAGGHFRQLEPVQVGFSGNMVLAMSIVSSSDLTIKNVDIHDLESETGLVHGVAIWTHCSDISFHESVSLYNFNAGTQVESGLYSYSDRPNKAPEACAFKVQWETIQNNEEVEEYETTDIKYDDVANWKICNIQGHVGCSGSDQYTTESGITYDESCSNTIDDQHSIKEMSENTKYGNSNFNSIIIFSIVLILVWGLFMVCFYDRLSKWNIFNLEKLDHKYALINNANTKYDSIENHDNNVI